MENLNVGQLNNLFSTYGMPLLWKVLGAIALWIAGGWIINAVLSMVNRGLTARNMDATLIQYIGTSLRVVLKILLIIAILGVFGVQTTSFAAIIAAAGVAIGMAWSGLLANFAAGVFLIILRPFKVGDVITAGGATGEVREIGLFATTLHTPDNLKVVVGNNKIFADNIVNYSTNAFRAVDLRAQIAHGVDPKEAMARLKARVAKVPNIVANPEPLVDILEFNGAGTLLVVRPFCHNKDYWQVYFDTNRAIQEVGKEAGYPVPEQRQAVRSLA